MRAWRSERRNASGAAERWLGEVGTQALLEKILLRWDAAGFGELECPTTSDVALMERRADPQDVDMLLNR